MTEIKLSQIVIDGLKCLDTTFSNDLMKKIISNAVKMSLHSDANIPANPEIYASKADATKQAEYAVLTILVVAIKHDLTSSKLRSLLQHHEVSAIVAEELANVYEKSKPAMRIKNLTTGLNLPHLTNVEWKLTCDVKSSNLDSHSGNLNFRINLGRFRESTGERETITDFFCSVEELQLLLGRLKEIERHCQKVSSNK